MDLCSFWVFWVLISCCNSVWGKTLDSDIRALQLIKGAIDETSISPASCLGSWDFSVDPCDFRSTRQFVCGLRCDVKFRGFSRVTSLALDGVGYSGFLHPAVGNLSELTDLELSGNGFHGPLPETIFGLGKLIRLDVSENSFSGPLPAALWKLRNLQVLSVSRNNFSGSIPFSINSLKNLLRTDLSYNKFTGVIPAMAGLSKLYNLDMSYNSFSGSIPSQLPPSVSQLTLKANILTGNLTKTLSTLSYLGVLDLSSNKLSGTIDGSLFSKSSLQQVNLSNNSFTSVTVQNSTGIPSQLVAVDLSFNRLRGYLPSAFATLQSLSALSLGHNQFQGSIPREYGVKARAISQPLVRIFLDGNYLVGKVPSEFMSVKNDILSGSFADNCLSSCPSSFALCKGPQKPVQQCRRFYRRVHTGKTSRRL